MLAYLIQVTFFYEVIVHMGELRLKKIRQLGQDRGTETRKQDKTVLLAYCLNKY